MKKVILCPNVKRDIGLKLTHTVSELLAAEGIPTLIAPLNSDLSDLLPQADMIITFGGDGTILHAARAAAPLGVPLLGVNMGRKGFIAEFEAGDIYRIPDMILSGATLEKRMMLDVSVIRQDETVYTGFCLNDVVVGSIERAIDLEVYGDGRQILSFSGDGIVVATPTGSTAYSLAAGGPIVEPVAENIIVTPKCAHTLLAKSYVLTPERKVTVVIGSLAEKNAFLSADGGKSFTLSTGDRVVISKSSLTTSLVKLADGSFYDKISKKLGE